MKMVEIQQTGDKLAGYLSLLKEDAEVMLCENGTPVAKLTREKAAESPRMFFGNPLYPFEVTDAFFDPLPDECLEAFNNPK